MKPTGIIDYLFPGLLYLLCFLSGLYLATHVHITVTLIQ